MCTVSLLRCNLSLFPVLCFIPFSHWPFLSSLSSLLSLSSNKQNTPLSIWPFSKTSVNFTLPAYFLSTKSIVYTCVDVCVARRQSLVRRTHTIINCDSNTMDLLTWHFILSCSLLLSYITCLSN